MWLALRRVEHRRLTRFGGRGYVSVGNDRCRTCSICVVMSERGNCAVIMSEETNSVPMAESPDLVIAKLLLDHVKAQGFQFQRVAMGPDGALLGTLHTVEWTDTVYLDGFSRDCYALRLRNTSLVVPGGALVDLRAEGDALNVLNAVLTWPERTTSADRAVRTHQL